MANNKGKKFETVIREAFEKIPGVSIDRMHDQMTRYKGSQNICDFIVYKEPYEYYIECKSVHGNTLPFSNITDTQWEGLLEKSKIQGVHAGIICWWVDKDVTMYLPIQLLQLEKETGSKSIRYDYVYVFCDTVTYTFHMPISIAGKKKRVFFEYDMESFFKEVTEYEVRNKKRGY